MNLITIVLADDHHLVRQGLSALLASQPDFTVVGEAADGIAACEVVERTQPTVLLLDLVMPGVGGMEVLRRVRQLSGHTRVLVLSMHANEAYALETLRAGATGYLLKEAQASELFLAVRSAAAGRRFLSPPLSERAIDAYLARTQETAFDGLQALTEREREILVLAAAGRSSTQIASQLIISPRTVETHRANLMRKLHLRNQAELVRFAIQNGLPVP